MPLERWDDFGRNRYKITGIGCKVCKWQAKQEWHESAINSMIAHKMQQATMLQHPNIATNHMAVIYRRCLTKYEHWATARSQHNRFKQAWQKCKRYQVHRLGEITGHGRKQYQVAMFRAWNQHATGTSHSKTRHGGKHVNIASFVNRFQTWQKTEHGRNSNMKASLWAWCTHHKETNDKTSIPTARWHVYEAIHGKNNCIACMDQLQ